jgi:hypothetical protein
VASLGVILVGLVGALLARSRPSKPTAAAAPSATYIVLTVAPPDSTSPLAAFPPHVANDAAPSAPLPPKVTQPGVVSAKPAQPGSVSAQSASVPPKAAAKKKTDDYALGF